MRKKRLSEKRKKWLRKNLGYIIVFVILLVIAIVVAVSKEDLEIFFTIIALPTSLLLAKYFGDVAGTEAAIEHQEELDEQARTKTLVMIAAATTRAFYAVRHNSHLRDQDLPPHRLPVIPFETAYYVRDAVLLDELSHQLSVVQQVDGSPVGLHLLQKGSPLLASPAIVWAYGLAARIHGDCPCVQ